MATMRKRLTLAVCLTSTKAIGSGQSAVGALPIADCRLPTAKRGKAPQNGTAEGFPSC